MAGAQGEGAPIAPPNWKWRCGNRLRDMYFYAPDGKLFRSRTELASYLGKLSGGPAPEDFCWRVTEESEQQNLELGRVVTFWACVGFLFLKLGINEE